MVQTNFLSSPERILFNDVYILRLTNTPSGINANYKQGYFGPTHVTIALLTTAKKVRYYPKVQQ